MEQHYVAKVKFLISDDNGKVKKQTRKYLVKAVSIGDAEVILHKNLGSLTVEEFEVTSVSEFGIVDYFTKDSAAEIQIY